MGSVPASLLVLLSVHVLKTTASIPDVCYSYLGCFSMEEPWFSALRPIPHPQRPEDVNTQFHLYTRQDPAHFVVTKLPNVTLAESAYDGSKTTFVLIHGFLSNSNMTWIKEMKDAILGAYDVNVIVVDWSKGSTQLNYLQAASNTRVAAAELVRLIKYLINDNGADLSRLHIVGHSLGAHIAGYVGKAVPGIARISALEAAQPGFEGFPTQVHLDKGDALFVEVIHTNARPFIPTLGFGYMAPIGHVDFYVNGGCDQPGCLFPQMPSIAVTKLEDLGKVSVDVLVNWVFCAHARAFYVFTSSIINRNCTIWGHKPNSLEISLSIISGGHLTQMMTLAPCTKYTCSPLGLETINYPARGIFLARTKGDDPYCLAESDSDSKMARYNLRRTVVHEVSRSATTDATPTDTSTDVSTPDASTDAPTTEDPTTEVPTTEAPTTEAPTTEPPPTEAPTTEDPTTEAATTEAPATESNVPDAAT